MSYSNLLPIAPTPYIIGFRTCSYFFVSIAYISNLVPIGVLCQIVACVRQFGSCLFLKKRGKGGGECAFQCLVLLALTVYKCTDINK